VTETTNIHFVVGPNRRITNPRWRTATILKNRKRPYLRKTLTDLHKIWHDDAFWPSEGYGQLKLPTFKNPTWRTAAILKINKRPYLRNCLTDLYEIWHGDANWHCKAYWQLELQTCENPLPSPLLPSLHPFPFPLVFTSHSLSTLPFFYPPFRNPFLPLHPALPSIRNRTC